MKAPKITNLQYAVLCAIGALERSGKEVRKKMTEFGIKRSLPSFYEAMARAEDAKLVKGWYENTTVGGQIVRERRYKLLGAGVRAMNEFRVWTQSAYADGGAETA